MAVQEDGRLSRRMQPLAVHERMIGGWNDLDVLHARALQRVGDEGSGAVDVGLVFGKSTYARDAQKGL